MTVSQTVLVVEDNAALREMLRRMLMRRGYEVVLAEDGREGLELAEKIQPLIILLDMSLPEMNGWEVAGALKSKDCTCDIPVIAITAHAMSGDRERTLHAGCDDYVSKPILSKKLYETIDRLL